MPIDSRSPNLDFGVFHPEYGEQYQRNPIGTSLRGNTSYDLYIVNIRPRMHAGHDKQRTSKIALLF